MSKAIGDIEKSVIVNNWVTSTVSRPPASYTYFLLDIPPETQLADHQSWWLLLTSTPHPLNSLVSSVITCRKVCCVVGSGGGPSLPGLPSLALCV